MYRFVRIAVLFSLFIATACGTGESYELGPPPDWQGEDGRWWKSGIDTSTAFRELESLADMGVVESRAHVSSTGSGAHAVSSAVGRLKASLIRLYRNHPEVVDSLFRHNVLPRMDEARLATADAAEYERLKSEAYRMITRTFQEPRTTRTLGDDVRVVYPDSLRQKGVSGTVRVQVHIDEKGEPLAVSLLESVHPVLDDVAMQATTEMRWRPAYLLRRGQWRAIPSWARFNVSFTTGS